METGLTQDSKEVVTPGVSTDDGKDTGEGVDEKLFRALAARGNYMAQDRIDLDVQYAAKEISRFMSAPEEIDWRKVKRLGKYLKGNKRAVYVFKNQPMPEKVVIWSDADFAGCKRTRKSTSGGVVMIGEHCLKTYSSTQPLIALSVGEAEYYGIIKAGCVGLGMQSLFRDLGVEVEVQINTDSSTGKSIASRKEVGKVRHLDTREQWIQERVARGDLRLKKVPGEEHLADILTKHVDRRTLDKHLEKIGFRRRSGRHPICPIHPRGAISPIREQVH